MQISSSNETSENNSVTQFYRLVNLRPSIRRNDVDPGFNYRVYWPSPSDACLPFMY